MEDVFTILLTIFVFVGVGYAAGKTRILDHSQNRVFSRFVFYVSLPCLVLALFGSQDVLGSITLNLLALSILPLLALVALIWLLHKVFKVSGRMTAMLILATVMPSSTFVGLPVTNLLLGEDGTKFAIIIGALHLLFTLLVSVPVVSLLTKSKHEGYGKAFRRVLSHPVFLALIAGIILNIIGVRLPFLLESPLQGIGASTSPVALFSIGLFMSGVKTNIRETETALLLAVFRLIPYSLLVFALSSFFGVAGMPLAVALLLSMMPVAVLSFVLSVEYRLDSEAMALGLLITALFLPVPVYLVSKLVG